jgi:hypothetical protein
VELLDTKPHANHLQALLRLVRDHWSSNSDYNAQSDEYPIAQAAVPAIEKLGFLALETADELYEIATKSRDPVLRSRLLTLLARAAGPSFQERLFALAAAPGVTDVRRAAAASLLRGHEGIAPEVVVRITPELLTTCLEPVASRLSLLLAARGHLDAVIEAAEALATNDKRRVLLLLLVWVLTGRDRTSADKVADMLPPDHPAIAWARGSDTDSINELVLEDLGDPLNVAEVLYWINQKKG